MLSLWDWGMNLEPATGDKPSPPPCQKRASAKSRGASKKEAGLALNVVWPGGHWNMCLESKWMQCLCLVYWYSLLVLGFDISFTGDETSFLWESKSTRGSQFTIAQAKACLEEVKFEAYGLFGDSRYAVTIAKCQQLALSKATGPVPIPADQLALANQKKDKESRSYHVCDMFLSGFADLGIRIGHYIVFDKIYVRSDTNISFWSLHGYIWQKTQYSF